jgi:hypothetical protein
MKNKIRLMNQQLKTGNTSCKFIRIKHYKNINPDGVIGRVDNFIFVMS